MSDQSPIAALEQQRVRLLEEAARKAAEAKEAHAKAEKVARDMADLQRLVAEYGIVVSASTSREGLTVAELINSYYTDPKSPYHGLRHKTRVSYGGLTKRIAAKIGDKRLADLTAADIQSAYDDWAASGALVMARTLITTLRLLVSFGVDAFGSAECNRLSVILHKLHFRHPKPKERRPLSAEEALKIREAARAKRFGSMAMAQALQFDCREQLAQRDIIGEWVPIGERGFVSEILDLRGKMKWVEGIRWNNIDDDLVLRFRMSRHDAEVAIDLRQAPSVLAELRVQYGTTERSKLPRSAKPIITNESTGRPWTNHHFRETWRTIAREVGVPDSVRNAKPGRPGFEREGDEDSAAGQANSV
jgi:hypothetical protein